jgi:copper(I)-binding protein
MRCDVAAEAISARLDGELTTAEAEALTEHLAACDACRRLEASFTALGRRSRVRPAEVLADRTREISTVIAPMMRQRRRRAVTSAAVAAVGTAAALLLAVGIVTQDTGADPVTASVQADRAQVVTTPSGSRAITMQLVNNSNEDRTLVDARLPSSDEAIHLHVTRSDRMRSVDELLVPRRSVKDLGVDGSHLMLVGDIEPAPGATVPVVLRFSDGAEVEVTAVVT